MIAFCASGYTICSAIFLQNLHVLHYLCSEATAAGLAYCRFACDDSVLGNKKITLESWGFGFIS